MRQLDAQTIKQLTPMPALVDALRDAFRRDIQAPPRTAHSLGPAASLLLMPAWHPGGHLGVKITHVDTDRSPAVAASYLLLDGESGRVTAMLDGEMLTARRTAAASALAADYLARPDAEHLVLLGTGTLAPHLVEAHAAIRPVQRVSVWGRNAGKAARVAESISAICADVEVAHGVAAAVRSADIVCCATSATSPILHGRDLKAGVHVDLVGAFRRGMREADTEVFSTGRVFVDTFPGALKEAGDLIFAIESGAISADAIAGDLAQLCKGAVPGRRDNNEISVFKSTGTAIEDLACAEFVLEQLESATQMA